MKKLLLIIGFVLLFGTSVQAQTPSDAEFDLMERSTMVAEIKKLRAENEGKDKLLDEKDKTIELYKTLDSKQEARIADLKEALQRATNVDNISVRIEGIYKEQLVDYRTENQRLRDRIDKLQKSRDRFGIITALIGFGLGKVL
jgi:hypothetical protein